MKDLIIAIPSYRRAHINGTWNEIPHSLRDKTFVVVHPDERAAYKSVLGPLGIHVSATKRQGSISAVRQYMIGALATVERANYVLMLDDDLKFFVRDHRTLKLHPASYADIEKMIKKMYEWVNVDGFFATGISARQGNNHIEDSYRDNTRMMNAYMLDRRLINWCEVRFDSMRVMEDFWVTLEMLTRGYRNRVFYEYAWNQIGSGAEGGCSVWRTGKTQRLAAEKLKRVFPDFVTLVEKESRSGWKGLEKRIDVRVQWRKAYASSQTD